MSAFPRVRFLLMSVLFSGASLLLQDAAAFYLPGLAPVSFCEKPTEGQECQVVHFINFTFSVTNLLIPEQICVFINKHSPKYC